MSLDFSLNNVSEEASWRESVSWFLRAGLVVPHLHLPMDTSGTDTGGTDTGGTDTGGTDSGGTDSGATDTGGTDTGGTDTGGTDTGGTDSGRTDSGGTDTGATDTGATDTGGTASRSWSLKIVHLLNLRELTISSSWIQNLRKVASAKSCVD